MAITENVMKAHVSRFRQPSHVKKGIQTSSGLIVKTNKVKFFVSWNPEAKWRYLAHWMKMNTLRFTLDGIQTFDQCHMTFRLFAEKKEIDKLYRLGVESGKFHEATGLMMEQLSSIHEKSSKQFVAYSIYETIEQSKELPSVASVNNPLHARLSDPVLANFVPRVNSNAEKVFMTFLTNDMCRGMKTLFTDHVSLEDSLDVLELVFSDEHAWTDIAIKYDIYYIVYGMIMDHLYEAPKTWIELGLAGTSGKFVEAITYMNLVFKNHYFD
jgi:hypothetical protein